MPLHRVTMQDIADACGLSRNTVSKVFNGRGTVQEETRQYILNKARELGYAQLPDYIVDSGSAPAKASVSASASGQIQTITVLARSNPLNHSFGSLLIKFFTDQICRSGYTVQLYEISAEECANLKLPPHVSLDNTAGILGIELFDRAYIDMVCKLGKPTVFVDGYLNTNHSFISCDHISMESRTSTRALVNQAIRNGAKHLSFVGDPTHCNSFNERYNAFCFALSEAGIPYEKEICMLHPDGSPYYITEWVVGQLKALPYMPDAFICANDYHAINIMRGLKAMGLQIPEDVMVTGFDDSPESQFIEPALTTVHIPSKEIGLAAADLMLKRIEDPQRVYSFSYLQTMPVFRGSTK